MMKNKLTVYIEEEIINKFKHYAIDKGKSMSVLIEEWMRKITNKPTKENK